MNNMIGKKLVVLSDQMKIDPDGEPYRETKSDYQGNLIEVNISRYGIHARSNNDSRTTRHSMDERGFAAWFMSLFGR
jgi:hypothetical protein